MRTPLALLLALSALALAACGDGEETTGGGATSPAKTTATEPMASGCEKGEVKKPREVADRKRPTFRVQRGKAYTATVTTSCGTLTIDLAAARAPKTVSSFVALAREDFYDGLAFHRIVPGFVAQAGDPLGVGQGGPGYEVVEAPPERTTYTRGTVAMAKGGEDAPGTSGSQFFVVTAPDAGLPPEYALLGKVAGGDDVIDKLDQVPTDPATEQPVSPVVVEDVEITTK